MVALRLVVFGGLIALVSAGPRKETQATTCTTVTKTVDFADLPTGTLSPKLDYHGLSYSGWEVVDVNDTVFVPQNGSSHFLRVVGSSATVQTAESSQYYLDYGVPSNPGNPSFFFGCQAGNNASSCQFEKEYIVRGETPGQGNTYNGVYYPPAGKPALERAGSGNVDYVQRVDWLILNVFGDTQEGLQGYIAEYIYTLSNCG